MQPVLAALLVCFIFGLAVRRWNALTFLGAAIVALGAAAILYTMPGYV